MESDKEKLHKLESLMKEHVRKLRDLREEISKIRLALVINNPPKKRNEFFEVVIFGSEKCDVSPTGCCVYDECSDNCLYCERDLEKIVK